LLGSAGHDAAAGDTVSRASWPAADPALLVAETVTCVIQVNGKVRDRIEVSPTAAAAELETAALASPTVIRLLDGHRPARVIVRPPRLVNVVLT